MTTSHLADGANRFVRSAASTSLNDFRAKAANDNRVARGNAPLPYARGVILAMGFENQGFENQGFENLGFENPGFEGEETPVVTLHLLLPDGEVGVAFHTAKHDDDVIALWRGLGRDFNLPLYIRALDGELSPVERALGSESHARRIGSPLSNRRPRFLARRRAPLKNHALAGAPRMVEQR